MGIGRRLSTPLLPHHLAYGSRTKAVRLGKLAFANRMFRSVCQSDTIALLEGQPQLFCRLIAHSLLRLTYPPYRSGLQYTVSWLQVEAHRTAGFPKHGRKAPSIPARLNAPTMPSADSCHTVKVDCSSFSHAISRKRLAMAVWQASRGKNRNFRFPINRDGFIKHTPIADGGLRGHVPTRPGCATPNIRFLFVAPHLWIGLPSDNTSRCCPCPSPNLRLREHLVRGLAPR